MSKISSGPLRRCMLQTPAVERVVPDGVFEAFNWCESDRLEWKCGKDFDVNTPIDGSDPARMVFVFHAACSFLPQELAKFHAFGLGLEHEMALAPYAIDDATDELFARKVQPRSLLWLAADNLNALFWGLHDWAHFHSFGPFEERAFTELQCDATALAWIHLNAAEIGIDRSSLERMDREVTALSSGRFVSENKIAPHVPTIFASMIANAFRSQRVVSLP